MGNQNQLQFIVRYVHLATGIGSEILYSIYIYYYIFYYFFIIWSFHVKSGNRKIKRGSAIAEFPVKHHANIHTRTIAKSEVSAILDKISWRYDILKVALRGKIVIFSIFLLAFTCPEYHHHIYETKGSIQESLMVPL